jgi:ribosome maturation factor RimP
VPIDQFVTVEDCEKVTRQLQFALEVDGVEYRGLKCLRRASTARCEASRTSSGFAGSLVIDITLKAPMGKLGASAGGWPVPTARNSAARWSGARSRPGALADRLAGRTCGQAGPAVSAKRAPAPLQALGFTLDELREARLAPVVDFKGRRPAGPRQAD